MGKEFFVEVIVTEYDKRGDGRRKFQPFAIGGTEEEASRIAVERLNEECIVDCSYSFDIRAGKSDLSGLAEDVVKDLEGVGSVV